MANAINSGSIDALNGNDTLLHKVWKTKSDKVRLEFVENIQSPFSSNNSNGGINLLYLANKSDVKFTSKGRRAWLTGQPEDVYPLFGIDPNHINNNWEMDNERGKEFVLVNILNPEVIGHASSDGEVMRARVKITEDLIPDEYQAEDLENRCKRKGAEGEAILHQGQKIFMHSDVVPCVGDKSAESTFLKPDNVDASVEQALNQFKDIKGLEV